ncbi:MAG: hypothetical protein JO112_10750 [Planctomycetes bacterium]|nr:hypothetical protein [Planctomycetota bacterium]
MATEMVEAPAPVFRHPLGLPAGSVRAVLSLMIAVQFWLLLLLPAEKNATVPIYLYMLVGLILLFFAAHGHSIAPAGAPHPWHLPRGTFRWLILLGSVVIVGWRWYADPELLQKRLTPDAEQLWEWPFLLLSLVGGFILGWLAHHGPWRNYPWFQDIQAWLSLIAMILLAVDILWRVFINPNLEQSMRFSEWECGLVAIVSLYFGIRA